MKNVTKDINSWLKNSSFLTHSLNFMINDAELSELVSFILLGIITGIVWGTGCLEPSGKADMCRLY